MTNKLKKFEDILIEYNQKVNLISRQESDIWNRHIQNSLLITPYLKVNDKIMDIGTGAGFPGMILALSDFTNITLVESKKKKCDFLHHISKTLDVNVNIINDDINKIKTTVDVITSRALASLNKLFSMTKNIIFKKMVLLKGDKILDEIADAEKYWYFKYTIHPHNIIEIWHIKQKKRKNQNIHS